MKLSKDNFRLPLILLLTFVYDAFFWNEKLGLNLFLFFLILAGTMLGLTPEARKSRNVWLTFGGSLLTAVLVVVYNSGTAKVAHFCSLTAFAGFTLQPELRTVLAAAGTFLENLWAGTSRLLGQMKGLSPFKAALKASWPVLRISLIPLLVLGLFFTIFTYANPRFSELSSSAATALAEWVGNFFSGFDLARLGFLFAGLLALVALLMQGNVRRYLDWDRSKNPDIKRVKKNRGPFRLPALRKENRIGVMMMAMVNLLLLTVNLIDLSWIWIGFEVPEHFDLSQFVHEGTYLLILSILVSMGIMLYFFRENQNFFRKNVWLKRLSLLWIAQNVFLTLSVGLRNFYYIDHHGLAYKRIGVVFFLMLVIFGLGTLAWKISRKKSTWFLLRANSWAVYGVMLVLTLVNWDVLIARYNLSQSSDHHVDADFLLELSDKALPVLWEHRSQFSDNYVENTRPDSEFYLSQKEELTERVAAFLEGDPDHSWLSWNWAEERARKKLNNFQADVAREATKPPKTTYSFNNPGP